MLVKTASKFRSNFSIQKGDMTINGKSIMGVMMLAAEFGSELELTFDGVDEMDAMFEIEKLIVEKFGED
jgi:phosphocarrier protein